MRQCPRLNNYLFVQTVALNFSLKKYDFSFRQHVIYPEYIKLEFPLQHDYRKPLNFKTRATRHYPTCTNPRIFYFKKKIHTTTPPSKSIAIQPTIHSTIHYLPDGKPREPTCFQPLGKKRNSFSAKITTPYIIREEEEGEKNSFAPDFARTHSRFSFIVPPASITKRLFDGS